MWLAEQRVGCLLMSRRIEVELTSSRDDGSWTWRAAGAREPRGVLDGGLLPAGAAVGDALRADVETGIDGTIVLAVLPPKGKRAEPERLELLPARQSEALVTSTLVGKGRGDRRDRADRGDRGDRADRPRPRAKDGEGRGRPSERRPAGNRPGASEGDHRPRPSRTDSAERSRPPRKERPAPPPKPRAKRLRAGRKHRKAALDALAPEQQVVAEQVLRGGVAAVRVAVDKQNEQARAEGHPEVKAEPLVALAEQLLPRLRAAEWHDRAEAALSDVDELDLRDLRSVVVAADTAARDDVTRDLAFQLRAALTRRVDEEQSAWLAEVAATLADDRVVRALRLSSRPPKAGAPLPPDLATRLAGATSAALTSDTATDRWATVLDALSFAPVRLVVTPKSVPDKPSDELVAAIRRVADRLPQIATVFGVEPEPVAKRGSGGRSRRSPGSLRKKRSEGMQDQSGLPVPPPPSLTQVFGAGAPTAPEAKADRSPDTAAGTEITVVTEAPAVDGAADAPGAGPTLAVNEEGSLAADPSEAPEAGAVDAGSIPDAGGVVADEGGLATDPSEAAEAGVSDDAGSAPEPEGVEASVVTDADLAPEADDRQPVGPADL